MPSRNFGSLGTFIKMEGVIYHIVTVRLLGWEDKITLDKSGDLPISQTMEFDRLSGKKSLV